MVVGVEMFGRDSRELHFIVALCFEPDGKGAGPPPAGLADHAGDGGAVCAATEKAGWQAGIEFPANSVLQQLAEFTPCRVEAQAWLGRE
ncbi:hypothetical protein DAPPUDRAFT_346475, partial [Daphnia pulex]